MTKTDKKFLLGIDLGATNVKIGIVSHKGVLDERVIFQTPLKEGKDAVIDAIAREAHKLLEKKGLAPKDIEACGAGAPGPLDHRTGTMFMAPNMKGWINVPIAKLLTQKLKIHTYLENDANAAAWGELWVGAAHGMKSIVMYTMGTGIGGGIICDSRLVRGRDGAAGELGHVIIVPDGEPCGCGSRGCLEAYASAPAIVRRYKSTLRWEVGVGAAVLAKDYTSEDIVKMANEGDPVARKTMEDTGKYIGRAVADILNILNPEMIVIGGGVANAGAILFEPLQEEVEKSAIEVARKNTQVIPAKLGSFAGVIGAAGCASNESVTSA